MDSDLQMCICIHTRCKQNRDKLLVKFREEQQQHGAWWCACYPRAERGGQGLPWSSLHSAYLVSFKPVRDPDSKTRMRALEEWQLTKLTSGLRMPVCTPSQTYMCTEGVGSKSSHQDAQCNETR